MPADAFDKAIALEPVSIVLLGAQGPDDAEALAARLESAQIKFYGVSLGGRDLARGSMKTLAERSGGDFREFTLPELQEYVAKAPPLP